MNGDPTLQVWLHRDVAGVCCVAGVTWPNGHYSEWRESSASVAGDGDTINGPHSRYDVAQLQRDYDVAKRHPAFAAAHPTFGEYKIFASHNDPLSRSAKASLAGKLLFPQLEQFFKQQWDKTPSLQQVWPTAEGFWQWNLRNPTHTEHNAINWNAIKRLPSALKQAAEIAAPLALNLVAPGAGVALSAAALAGKAVSAASSASKIAQTVAKAKAVTTVAKALANPRTQQALQSVGVQPDQAKRAAHMFEGIRNATAAIALQAKGNTAAAEPYKRAAAANAAAARMPAKAIHQSAQKLYYLALTPGGA